MKKERLKKQQEAISNNYGSLSQSEDGDSLEEMTADIYSD